MVTSGKVSRRAVVVSGAVVVVLALMLQGCGNSRNASLFPLPSVVVNLFVPDSGNNRVLIYKSPFVTGQTASAVLGQSDFTSSSAGATASTMAHPSGVGHDPGGNLYVAEHDNCRILQFKPSFNTGMSATLALGQPDLTTATCNIPSPPAASATNLDGPTGAAADSNENLWLADAGYSRVLLYPTPLSSGEAATVALGQPDLTTASTNCPANSTPTASSLCNSLSVAVDHSGNVWVADAGSNRVLRYSKPFATNMDATLELGQPSASAFTSGDANNGGISGSTLSGPAAVAVDPSGNIWVADTGNHRVLEFKAPFSNGMEASVVVGQTDFSSGSANQGGAASASSFSSPQGLQFDSAGDLFVGDSGNNRTLRFVPPFTNGMSAVAALGQPDFTQTAANQGGSTSASTQDNPYSAGPSWIALLVLAVLVAGWFYMQRKRQAKGATAV